MRNMEFRLNKEMDKRIGKSTARILREVDRRILKSESSMLDEMERYDKKNEARFREIMKRIDVYENTYRIAHLEADTVSTLLKSNDNLEKRVLVVEKKVGVA
ncbi:MAG: hypothetical protein K1W34_03560 [Lachnospiraceae bacterium]